LFSADPGGAVQCGRAVAVTVRLPRMIQDTVSWL
jgi:hypothetical protein